MDSQSLTNVLAIMRVMNRGKSSDSGRVIISRLAGKDKLSDALVLRVADHVLEQITLAQGVIENSPMRDEAKAGVAQTLKGLARIFSLDHVQEAWGGSLRDITGAISNFVILLDAAAIEEKTEPPEEAFDLIKEISAVIEAIRDPGLDPVVRAVAEKHLTILSLMLQHIPIFGLEGALTAYFEMMSRIRRAEVQSSPEAKSKFEPIWTGMSKWTDKLNKIDKIWNSGARMIEHADKASGLLEYIPHF